MEFRIGSSFKKVKALCYKEHKDGFYVYAKPNHCDPKAVANYIGRYLGRPMIATSRIDKYDGDFVTFHYNRHNQCNCHSLFRAVCPEKLYLICRCKS